MNKIEPGVDLALAQTSLLPHVILMPTGFYLHKKRRAVCIGTRSTPASLLFKGLVTEHRTVKCSIKKRICLSRCEINAIFYCDIAIRVSKLLRSLDTVLLPILRCIQIAVYCGNFSDVVLQQLTILVFSVLDWN